jgi:O-antigen ligase
MNPSGQPSDPNSSIAERLGRLGQYTAVAGFALFVIFLPHSVAAADISIAIATVGWLVRTLATRRTGLSRTGFDWPILLFLLWTAASSIFSREPDISMAKLPASWVVLVFYLTQAIISTRTALFLVLLLILSGLAGTVYSIFDVVRGRGIVVEAISAESPFQPLGISTGDTIWRLDGERVYSLTRIDEILRNTPAGKPLAVSLITQGEQVERPGLLISAAMRDQGSPSGITGSKPIHRFRASGWTRHYQSFAELLQIIAQLALGLAVANLRNHGANWRFKLAFVIALLLGVGIALTAMRTVLIAFCLGAMILLWRSLKGQSKLLLSVAVLAVLAIGGLQVWQTRAQMALALGDPSSSLRAQVAKVGLVRIARHPLFGHGMDSMHRHWTEWGFPGQHMLHLHSTPLQIAFDRGIPALVFWSWLMAAFWVAAARAERASSEMSDTNRYGLLLGIMGALTGFFASSLVNYNFGDAEATLGFWWLMGLLVVLKLHRQSSSVSERTTSNPR